MRYNPTIKVPDPDEPYLDVTYASLGIEPADFYRAKFAGQPSTINYLRDPRNEFDIECSRLRFLASHIRGGRVLDVGCGSGPYGKTLKEHCGVEKLVGVDLDAECVSIAAESYDRAECFDLSRPLPFPDSEFDTVFSVDVFGHIEFRHKNHLIDEIWRVTKPGGLSVHVIESGALDYHSIDLKNAGDPLLQYIKLEGHVGVEAAAQIKRRWERRFQNVSVENAFIFPLYPLATYTSPGSRFNERFRSLVSSFTEEQKRAAQIVLGFASDQLKEIARQVDPIQLMPLDETERLPSDVFRRSCGLVYLVCRK